MLLPRQLRTATVSLALLGLVWPLAAQANSCHGNLIRLSRDLGDLASALHEEAMDRSLEQWDVPVGFGRPVRGFDPRFGYNRASIFDDDNPWTGTRPRRPVIATPSREVPVYRAIPVR